MTPPPTSTQPPWLRIAALTALIVVVIVMLTPAGRSALQVVGTGRVLKYVLIAAMILGVFALRGSSNQTATVSVMNRVFGIGLLVFLIMCLLLAADALAFLSWIPLFRKDAEIQLGLPRPLALVYSLLMALSVAAGFTRCFSFKAGRRSQGTWILAAVVCANSVVTWWTTRLDVIDETGQVRCYVDDPLEGRRIVPCQPTIERRTLLPVHPLNAEIAAGIRVGDPRLVPVKRQTLRLDPTVALFDRTGRALYWYKQWDDGSVELFSYSIDPDTGLPMPKLDSRIGKAIAEHRVMVRNFVDSSSTLPVSPGSVERAKRLEKLSDAIESAVH